LVFYSAQQKKKIVAYGSASEHMSRIIHIIRQQVSRIRHGQHTDQRKKVKQKVQHGCCEMMFAAQALEKEVIKKKKQKAKTHIYTTVS
jgi:hypothetical protein